MIHYFTNREIAEKLDVNLARWKRWSRAFLPPDPLGGLQSGYARQYVFKDLFKVYLGGHFLSHLKLSVAEAAVVLADLSPWLKKAGYLELNGSIEKLREKAAFEQPCRIYMQALHLKGEKRTVAFGYLVRKTISTRPDSEGDGHRITQSVEETILNCDIPDGRTFLQAPEIYMVNLSALFYVLSQRLVPPG